MSTINGKHPYTSHSCDLRKSDIHKQRRDRGNENIEMDFIIDMK